VANKFKKNKINVGTYRVKSSNNYNRLADATTTTTTTNTITTTNNNNNNRTNENLQEIYFEAARHR